MTAATLRPTMQSTGRLQSALRAARSRPVTFNVGRFRTMRLFALVLILLFVTNLSATEQALDAQIERMSRIDRFAWDGPKFLPNSSLENLRKLDRIASETSKTEPNPYDEGLVRYTNIRFKHGLEVNVRTFGSPEQMQYIRVIISSPRWPMQHDLAVGVSIDKVISFLGGPDKKDRDWISYSGETEQVVFSTKRGKITSVIIDRYAD